MPDFKTILFTLGLQLKEYFPVELRVPTSLQSLLNKMDETEKTNPFAWS